MGFRQENVQSYHPLGIYKDWNDALLNKKSPSLTEQGISDNFDYGEFIASQRAEREAERQQRETEKHQSTSLKR